MRASRLHCLLLGLLTSSFVATAIPAVHAASLIRLWRGADATFEMFESEGKLSAKIVASSEPTTAEGKIAKGLLDTPADPCDRLQRLQTRSESSPIHNQRESCSHTSAWN
jgi:hypothetical protein